MCKRIESKPATDAPKELPFGVTRLLVLGLLGALPPFTMEIYIPSLPSMQKELSASPGAVLLTISVYSASFATCQLLLGPFSDVYGRRKVLLFGMAIYVLASLVVSLVSTVPMMLFPRVLQAVGSSSGAILSIAFLRDSLTLSQREVVTSKLAIVRSCGRPEPSAPSRNASLPAPPPPPPSSLSPMARTCRAVVSVRSCAPLVAPIVGSLLQATLGWRACFHALTLIGALSLAGVHTTLPESLPVERRQPRFNPLEVLRANGTLLRSRHFMCYALPEAFGFGALFVWISSSSFILQARSRS